MNRKITGLLLFFVLTGMGQPGPGKENTIQAGKVSAYVVVVGETYCNPCIPKLDSLLPARTGSVKRYEIIYATQTNDEAHVQDFIHSFSRKFRRLHFSRFHVVSDTALVHFVSKGKEVFNFKPEGYKLTPFAIILDKKVGSSQMIFP